jgi:hypothetical protein
MADPLDELYAGPLDSFVARRKDLAAASKAAGDDEEAAAIKKAVKPTMSAWIVNQVAHHHPRVVDRLLAATAEVVRAQLDASGDPDDRARYERALGRQREAEDEVADAVREVVGEPNADLARRVLENFRRGALNPETRQELRSGRLTRDLELQDFGMLLQQLGGRPAPPRPAKSAEQRERKGRDAAAAARREAERQAEATRKAAEAERRKRQVEARREVERAERRVEELRVELATAERELERARVAAERA